MSVADAHSSPRHLNFVAKRSSLEHGSSRSAIAARQQLNPAGSSGSSSLQQHAPGGHAPLPADGGEAARAFANASVDSASVDSALPSSGAVAAVAAAAASGGGANSLGPTVSAAAATASAASPASVAPSPGSFSRGGRPLNFVPVRSLAGGTVAPLVMDRPASITSQHSGGAGAAGVISEPLPQVSELGGLSGAAAAGGGGAVHSGGSDSDVEMGSSVGPDSEAQTWLVVEFCDNGTLADAVRNGRLGPRGSPNMVGGRGGSAGTVNG